MFLHADLDAFYASVEQRYNPRLRGRPIVVGGGVVLAASYEAKRLGIKTAMTGSVARRICPQVIVVPPRMSAYTEASKAVFYIFHDTSPWVEGLSIDEAFLDVSGLSRIAGSPRTIATELRRRVATEVELPITVGIANTKFLAKVASAVGKPDGLLEVPEGGEIDFLHPLAVERLWGVGPVTSAKLRAKGITTVAEIARLDQSVLTSIVGKGHGAHLYALAHNRDPRRVQVGKRRGSIGSQQALGRSRPDLAETRVIALGIIDRVTRRLRAADRVGRTVVLRLRFDDFTRATRSHTLAEATSSTGPIQATVDTLITAVWPEVEHRGGLSLIGMSVSGLSDADAVQLALPLGPRARPSVDTTYDAIRDKFGSDALGRGAHLGRNMGMTVPMLPD